jgi:hypothetical protein
MCVLAIFHRAVAVASEGLLNIAEGTSSPFGCDIASLYAVALPRIPICIVGNGNATERRAAYHAMPAFAVRYILGDWNDLWLKTVEMGLRLTRESRA